MDRQLWKVVSNSNSSRLSLESQLWCAVWPWIRWLTSLCQFPHGKTRIIFHTAQGLLHIDKSHLSFTHTCVCIHIHTNPQQYLVHSWHLINTGDCCPPKGSLSAQNATPLPGHRFCTELSVNFLFPEFMCFLYNSHHNFFFLCSHCLSTNQFILDNLIWGNSYQ